MSDLISLTNELPNASELLARRIRLFGTVLVVQLTFFGVVGNAIGMIHPAAQWRDWLAPSNGLLLGAAMVFGAMALAASPARPERELRATDMFGTPLGLAFVATVAVFSPAVQRPELSVVVALTMVLVVRAVLVPSTWARTAWVGLFSSLAVIAAAWRAHVNQPPGDWNLPVVLYPAITSVFAALAVATSALTSRVIFGLRARADRATRLGQYVLEEKIGQGGMGIVYRARHAMLRRPTAIKLLDPTRAGDDALARFEREVRATSRLTHPNTVAVYDYGRTQDGTFYYAMELLDGLTLDQLVASSGPLPAGRVIKLLEQICGSLSEAHEAGLVHRDVKPANIMICERSGAFDVVKVLDFGLVKEMDRNETGSHARRSLVHDADLLKTEANVVMGTPLYLAPEAIRRRPVDARADVYAVGCVAYFLLTGVDAFAGPNLDAVLESHLDRKPESPTSRLREVHGEERAVPEDLEAIVLACLAKVPSDRPQTARELRASLLACADRAAWTEEDARAWWAAKPTLARATTELENAPTETLIIDWSSRVEGAAAAPGEVGPLSRRDP